MNGMRKFIYKVLNHVLYSGKFGEVGLRKNLFSYLPNTPMNYIDVGAFKGDFFEVLRKEKDLASVVLVEPQKDLFEELKQKYGNDTSIELNNRLLSDKEEEMDFFIYEKKATSSILPISKSVEQELQMQGSEKIQMKSCTLDQLVAGKFDRIDLLKIDVQGAELSILKGAAETLKRTNQIWIEVSFRPIYTGSAVFNDIYSFLNDNGFILKTILEGYRSNEHELLQADCLFEKKHT
jgi:FkbM family methyltransferase